MRGRLTEREREVLALSSTLNTKQVAVELGISKHTVAAHLSNVYLKLGVFVGSNRGKRPRAIYEAVRRGEIAPHDIPEVGR